MRRVESERRASSIDSQTGVATSICDCSISRWTSSGKASCAAAMNFGETLRTMPRLAGIGQEILFLDSEAAGLAHGVVLVRQVDGSCRTKRMRSGRARSPPASVTNMTLPPARRGKRARAGHAFPANSARCANRPASACTSASAATAAVSARRMRGPSEMRQRVRPRQDLRRRSASSKPPSGPISSASGPRPAQPRARQPGCACSIASSQKTSSRSGSSAARPPPEDAPA